MPARPPSATTGREQVQQVREQSCGKPDLLDHLVGADEQRRRHFEAECPRSLEIDEQLELRGLLYRQIGRFRLAEGVVYSEPSFKSLHCGSGALDSLSRLRHPGICARQYLEEQARRSSSTRWAVAARPQALR
jgi:hypothetical protein